MTAMLSQKKKRTQLVDGVMVYSVSNVGIYSGDIKQKFTATRHNEAQSDYWD